MDVHLTQKDVVEKLLPWPDETADGMKDWGHGSWVMRPRRCSKRRLRYCPYDVITAWRSFRKLRSLFNDFPVLIMPYCDDTPSFVKTSQNLIETDAKKDEPGSTNPDDKDSQEVPTSIQSEADNDEQKVHIAISKDCNQDTNSSDKMRSVDVSGRDEARAFTEGGPPMEDSRGRDSYSSMMVRHVTTPPHIKLDPKTTVNGQKETELSHESDQPPGTNNPTTDTHILDTSAEKAATGDQHEVE